MANIDSVWLFCCVGGEGLFCGVSGVGLFCGVGGVELFPTMLADSVNCVISVKVFSISRIVDCIVLLKYN